MLAKILDSKNLRFLKQIERRGFVKNKKGISLVELMVVLGLLFMGLSVSYLLIDYTSRSFETVARETFLQQNSRTIRLSLSKELRNIIDLSTVQAIGFDNFLKIKKNRLNINGDIVTINIVEDGLLSVTKEDESFFAEYEIILKFQNQKEKVSDKVGLNNYTGNTFHNFNIKENVLYIKPVIVDF